MPRGRALNTLQGLNQRCRKKIFANLLLWGQDTVGLIIIQLVGKGKVMEIAFDES